MVIFDTKKHTYTNPDTKEIYCSVSQLLAEYKEPFDSEFFASRVAAKEGVDKKDILAKWAKNSADACNKGKEVHAIVEGYIKNDQNTDNDVISHFKAVFDKKAYKEIHSEKMVWSDAHKIAGTSDLIAEVNKDFFDVYDLKTNNKFLFNNKYGKYLKPPLNNLQTCQYNDYALQLSLYAFLYSAQTGKKVRQLGILYYDGQSFSNYATPYMFWEVSVLLKHYGQTLNSKSKVITDKVH